MSDWAGPLNGSACQDGLTRILTPLHLMDTFYSRFEWSKLLIKLEPSDLRNQRTQRADLINSKIDSQLGQRPTRGRLKHSEFPACRRLLGVQVSLDLLGARSKAPSEPVTFWFCRPVRGPRVLDLAGRSPEWAPAAGGWTVQTPADSVVHRSTIQKACEQLPLKGLDDLQVEACGAARPGPAS
jgi:hypothetical protein